MWLQRFIWKNTQKVGFTNHPGQYLQPSRSAIDHLRTAGVGDFVRAMKLERSLLAGSLTIALLVLQSSLSRAGSNPRQLLRLGCFAQADGKRSGTRFTPGFSRHPDRLYSGFSCDWRSRASDNDQRVDLYCFLPDSLLAPSACYRFRSSTGCRVPKKDFMKSRRRLLSCLRF